MELAENRAAPEDENWSRPRKRLDSLAADSAILKNFRRFSQILFLLLGLIGLLSFWGHSLSLPLVSDWTRQYFPFSFSTSIAISLLGLSAFLISRTEAGGLSVLASLLLSVVSLALGLLAWGQFFPLALSLWSVKLNQPINGLPLIGFSLPSPLLAIELILASLALLLYAGLSTRSAAAFLAFLVFIISSLSLLSLWLVGSEALDLASLSESTWLLLVFWLWSLALVLSAGEDSPLAATMSQGRGGEWARRFLPLVVLWSLLLAFAVAQSLRLGWLSVGQVLWIVTSLFALTFFLFVLWVAEQMRRLERDIETGAQEVNLTETFKAYSLGPERPRLELEQNGEVKGHPDRIKSIFDKSPNFIFIKNKQGFYEFVNPKFEDVYRIKSVDLKGKTGLGVFPREVFERWQIDDAAVINQGKLTSAEGRVVGSDGAIKTYSVTRFPLMDEAGEIRAVCGIGTDITDLRDYQNLLVQEKAKDEAILDSVGEGLIATDNAGRIILMNRTCQELLGYQLTDFENKLWVDRVRLEDEAGELVPPNERPLNQALKLKKKVFSGDYYYVRRDGHRLPIFITATPILFEGGSLGAIASFRDISREKELDKAKDEFVFMVSHELKAPMTAVKAGLSVVLEGRYGVLSDQLKGVMAKMAESVDRLLNLVEDILNVSRLDSGAVKLDLQNQSTKSVIEEVVNSLKILAQNKGIKLSVGDLSDDPVLADRFLASEVITNLISNAIKFTDRGEVTVFTKQIDDFLEVNVQDSGRGISAADQTKLFKKFQQITSGQKGRPEGTGLGLYISQQMSRLMGGDLRLVSSKEGQGSLFVLQLPLVKGRSVDSESKRIKEN